MRDRPAARLLVLDPDDRLLLFKFEFRREPLNGSLFWATPGGAVDPGETFEAAALRELFEETGIVVAHPGPQVATREAVFRAADGEPVRADERYFLIRTDRPALSREGWTALEREVMTAHRWWTIGEIRGADEQIWPEDLADIVAAALAVR